jgi:hypothetical protein
MKDAKKARRVQTNKTNYMTDEAFADIKEAMEDALAFERGERRDLNVTRIRAPRPPKSYVSSRYCSNSSTAQLLAIDICNDAKHQPKDCSGLGARFKGARRRRA